ncbi:hypothetical protein ACIQBJ_31145 [Kitasatospora sp. NPDC088391]|uniref:hypothetical protein n=1 Tax=Kitasatospora sp. NPDC088391 TaxID=3364074 RepID=UPI00380712A2
MTIHRPGLPEDLPPAEVLWGRWALLAALGATTAEEENPPRYRTGRWLDGAGLHWDDCGCTWWVLSPCGPGRFVLYGEDEASEVKWHEPRIDMLAGAPAWLPYPEIEDRLEGLEVGCVYWYENGAWARAPYPDGLADDGLDCGVSCFVERPEVLGELAEHLADGADPDLLLAAAEAHRLDPDLLLAALSPTTPDGDPLDRPALLGVLARAGLTAQPVTADAP